MKRATALIAALSVALVAALALALNTLKPVSIDASARPVAAAEAKAPAPAHDVQDVAAVDPSPLPYSETLTTASGPQAWADQKVTQFLNGQGARSFSALEGQAAGNITAWSAPKVGHLVLEVSGKSWAWDDDLLYVAQLFMSSVGYESDELIDVKVVAPDSGASGTYGRADMTNANPWTA
ncbi:hypothetical protein [Glutamicibacter arilaitensis]|uniref:hypothetical protein n=1 Tax=Glutamicibacter arilaitensis TaxID=256701 RepID=UPI003FD191B8